MTDTKREDLIRQYAACDVTWTELREKGFDGYLDVLGAPGTLGPRPKIGPMASMHVRIGDCRPPVVGSIHYWYDENRLGSRNAT